MSLKILLWSSNNFNNVYTFTKKNPIHSEIVDLDIIMTAEIKNSNLNDVSENEITENGKGNRNTRYTVG